MSLVDDVSRGNESTRECITDAEADRQAFGTTRRAAFLNSASTKISKPILNSFLIMDSRWYVPVARLLHAVLTIA